MDNVKAVQRWTDGSGKLYETEEHAIQGEARRIVCNILGDAVKGHGRVDIEMLITRRTALIDALRKIEVQP